MIYICISVAQKEINLGVTFHAEVFHTYFILHMVSVHAVLGVHSDR